MAANTNPIFVLTPKSPAVRIATANVNRDGSTGTYGTLFTAGVNGAYFKAIRAQAEGVTTAGVVRVFIQDGGAGNVELRKELLIPAVTPSATIEAASIEWAPDRGFLLSAGSVVKVSTHNAETFGVSLEGGGDY